MLAGLGHQDRGAGSSGFGGGGRSRGYLVLGLGLDSLSRQGLGTGVLPEGASGFMVTIWQTSPDRSMGRRLDGTPTLRVQAPCLVSGGSSFTKDMGLAPSAPWAQLWEHWRPVRSHLSSFWAGKALTVVS